MVDDVKKAAVAAADETASVMTPSHNNPGLKLRINLRDRQTIRKRHRSSSPASSDSSSGRNNAAVAVTQPVQQRAKRNRKEPLQTRSIADDDETSVRQDTPPASNGNTMKTML